MNSYPHVGLQTYSGHAKIIIQETRVRKYDEAVQTSSIEKYHSLNSFINNLNFMNDFDILDNYKEHVLHQNYDPNCSTCFSENLRVKESAIAGRWVSDGEDVTFEPW